MANVRQSAAEAIPNTKTHMNILSLSFGLKYYIFRRGMGNVLVYGSIAGVIGDPMNLKKGDLKV